MINRREVCSLLPLLALTNSWAANDQTLSSRTWPFEELQAKASGGHTTRPVVNGKISTGEHVEVHETKLDPGVRLDSGGKARTTCSTTREQLRFVVQNGPGGEMVSKMRACTVLMFAACALSITTVQLFGQAVNGTLVGTITDSSGAVVAG